MGKADNRLVFDGILRVMRLPKFLPGFTIIELLIVVSLFGLAASLVTASYLTFERNQRVKNGALSLKSNLRLTQNKALSGDKSYFGDPQLFCGTTSVLIGWYISVSTAAGSNNSYTLAGSCQPGTIPGNDAAFNLRTISLPKGVTISGIRCGSGDFTTSPAYVLFRPLSYNASFHKDSLVGAGNRPPFLTSSGAYAEQWCSALSPTDVVTIELTGPSNGRYDVEVKPSGEVNEKKP